MLYSSKFTVLPSIAASLWFQSSPGALKQLQLATQWWFSVWLSFSKSQGSMLGLTWWRCGQRHSVYSSKFTVLPSLAASLKIGQSLVSNQSWSIETASAGHTVMVFCVAVILLVTGQYAGTNMIEMFSEAPMWERGAALFVPCLFVYTLSRVLSPLIAIMTCWWNVGSNLQVHMVEVACSYIQSQKMCVKSFV